MDMSAPEKVAGSPDVDRAFHVPLAHQIRMQSPVTYWLFGPQFRIWCVPEGYSFGQLGPHRRSWM